MMIRHSILKMAISGVITTWFIIGANLSHAADWPTYRQNAQRTGVTDENLAFPLQSKWVHHAAHSPNPAWPQGPARNDLTHDLITLSPTHTYDRTYHVAVGNQSLYYGSSTDDTLYCVDTNTGKVRWTFVTEGPIRVAPTLADGKVYVGSDDGYVYCLSASTGKLIWKQIAGPRDRRLPGNGRMISMWPVRSGVAKVGNTVYFSAGIFPKEGVYLCAADAISGKKIWTKKINVPSQGYLLASSDRLIMPTGRSAPIMFQRKDGAVVGHYKGRGSCFTILTEDLLVVGPNETGTITINSAKTRERIISTLGLQVIAHKSMVYILDQQNLRAMDRSLYIDLGNQIARLSAKKKKTPADLERLHQLKLKRAPVKKWDASCDSHYDMILAGDAIITGGENKVLAFSTTTGKKIFQATVDGRAYGLAVSDGHLYVSTDKGTIHCFGMSDSNASERTVTLSKKESPSPYSKDDASKLCTKAAEAIVKKATTTKGYCVVLDAGNGQLAYEIAKRSQFNVIAVVPDSTQTKEARRFLKSTGLYGKRIVVHERSGNQLAYTDCFANLVVSAGFLRDGTLPKSLDEIHRIVRPSGGVAVVGRLGQSDDIQNNKATKAWFDKAAAKGWRVEKQNNLWATWQRSSLPGSGEWTHQYANAGNSSFGGESAIRSDMQVQWFGSPGPSHMMDRHSRTPAPLSVNGRLFIPGSQYLYGLDSYNGTVLWEKDIPEMPTRVNLPRDSGFMAADDHYLYVAVQNQCWRLDGDTGHRSTAFAIPKSKIKSNSKWEYHWGYLAYQGDCLFGSAVRKGNFYTNADGPWYDGKPSPSHYKISSDYLFALNKTTGQPKWIYDGLIINTTIAAGDGKIFFVETRHPKLRNAARRRLGGNELWQRLFLVSLDANTGEKLWEQPLTITPGKVVFYMCYSQQKLVIVSSPYTSYILYAHNANNGKRLWSTESTYRADRNQNHHGGHMQHPVIMNGFVYQDPHRFNLKTGKKGTLVLTRDGHGCGSYSGATGFLLGRGDQPRLYDLDRNGKSSQLTKITRPGCWINIIPAGGMILIPEASSGCTCAYSLQTSMGLIPKH